MKYPTEAIKARRKAIEMIDCSTGTRMTFDSVSSAAKHINVRPQRVSECLTGAVKTIKLKYKFHYIINNQN